MHHSMPSTPSLGAVEKQGALGLKDFRKPDIIFENCFQQLFDKYEVFHTLEIQ